MAFFAGLAFGLLVALTGGIELLDGLLIAAYVLVAAFVTNLAIFVRTLEDLGDKAVEMEAGSRPVEEVVYDMAASPAIRYFSANVVLFAAIIVDMVLSRSNDLWWLEEGRSILH